MVTACGENGTEPQPQPEPAFFPADFAQTYTEVRDCRFSIEHDGWNVTVHANDIAVGDYTSGTYPLSEGAILVKTLYGDDACNDVVGYVAMRKEAAGYAPSTNDWAWQELNASSVAENTGRLNACITCHTSCTNDRDFTCTNP